MAGDEQTRRLDHAPDRRPRQRPGVPRRRRADQPADTYGSLAARLRELGRRAARCARWASAPPFIEQPEHGVTYAEKIGAGDRLLDPARPARRARARRARAAPAHRRARRARRRHAARRAPRGAGRSAGDRPAAPTRRGELLTPASARATGAAARCRPACSSCSSCSRRAGARWTPPPICAVTACPGAGSRSRRAAARSRAQPRVRLGRARPGRPAGSRPPRPPARSPPRRRAAARCAPSPRPRRSASASTEVAFSSFSVGGRTSRQRPGTMCSTIASSAASFSPRSSTLRVAPSSITER